MNAFNRFVLIVVALLLIAVPVLLLLVGFGVLSLGLGAVVQSLQGVTSLDLTAMPVRVIAVVAGALIALLALLLLLRELTLGKMVSRKAVIQDEPGKETVLTSKAVKTLADGAAREAGAKDPSTSLTSRGKAYFVESKIKVPEGGNYTEIASRTRENVSRVLKDQKVSVKDVEVTVQGRQS